MGINRGRKGAPSSSKSVGTARDDDVSSDDSSSVPGTATYSFRRNGSLTKHSKSPRRRRRFTPTRRSEVAFVRKFGACMECRKKKIAVSTLFGSKVWDRHTDLILIQCKHVLESMSQSNSPSASIASPNPDSNFEASHPDLSLNNQHSDYLHPDVTRRKSMQSSVDSMYPMYPMDMTDTMLRDIPTPAAHSDRMALDMHDFDAMFGGRNVALTMSSKILTVLAEFPTPTHLVSSFPTPSWASPYQPDDASEPLMSDPSSRSDNTYFSSLSPTSSSTSDNDSMLTFRNATTHVYHCNVVGCDLHHGFASDLDLRRHQESRHADLFPSSITFTCPVNGCRNQHWPFVRQDKLQEHMRFNHPDFFQKNQGSYGAASDDSDPLRPGKQQLERFLAGEYLPGLDNDLVAFPARQRLPGENTPFLQSSGRETTSSRGRGRVQKPQRARRPSTSARNAGSPNADAQTFASSPSNSNMQWGNSNGLSQPATSPISIPQRRSPPSRNLEQEWNSGSGAAQQPMRDAFGLTYVSAQESPAAPGYGSTPDTFDSFNLQMIGQTYGRPPPAPIPYPQMNQFPMAGTMPQQQSFGNTDSFQTGFPEPGNMQMQMQMQQNFVGQNSFQNGYSASSQQQGFPNFNDYQNESPARPRASTHPRRGPAIRVRPPTLHEDDARQTPYTAPPGPSPIAESPLLYPLDRSSMNYRQGQHNRGLSLPSQQLQQRGIQNNNFVENENWMADPSMDEIRSISDTYEMMSAGTHDGSSLNYSSPGSESRGNRRTSLISQNQIMLSSLSRPTTPPSMERDGPRSSSSDASPYTAAEAPNAAAYMGQGDFGAAHKYSFEEALQHMSPDKEGLFDL